MQSNNPIFRRSEEFNRGGANPYGNQTYAGNGAPVAGYGQTTDPSQWSVGTPGDTGRAPTTTGPMTIDSVVQKTAITLGVVILTAMATWILTPDVTRTNADTVDLGPLFAAVTIGSLGAFALSMVNSFKRVISPALVLAFAALEGVALGAISKLFNLDVPGRGHRRGDRHVRRLRRHARGVQGPQHQGRRQVPPRRHRCGLRHGRASA